jgi:lipopolysaccharide transport system ATP-binding protein
MDYEVLKNNTTFTHSMNLFNENGVHILSSHDLNSELRNKPRTKGCYSSTMWVPGQLFSGRNRNCQRSYY